MGKSVRYACAIKPVWLNKTVELIKENLDDAEIKEKINEYLAFEIDSVTRLRKTREILMHIWVYDDASTATVKKEALDLMERYPEFAVAIHLCMIYLAYPVFADVCTYMGKLFNFYDEITTSMIRQKLYDEWGERTTLEPVTRRVTLTLRELGLLKTVKKTRYVVNPMVISCDSIVNFMLDVVMRIDGNSYYPYTNLLNFNILFPFKFEIKKERLILDRRFIVTNFNGDMCIALKEKR